VPKTRSNGPGNAACSSVEKIPPPSLLPEHQAGRVVQQRQVTEQRRRRAAAGPLVRERRPDGGGHRAVDAAGAPAGEHPDVRPRRHVPVQVPGRHAGSDPEQAAARQPGGHLTGHQRLADRGLGAEYLVCRGTCRGIGGEP
jgi:hypothetical protein